MNQVGFIIVKFHFVLDAPLGSYVERLLKPAHVLFDGGVGSVYEKVVGKGRGGDQCGKVFHEVTGENIEQNWRRRGSLGEASEKEQQHSFFRRIYQVGRPV